MSQHIYDSGRRNGQNDGGSRDRTRTETMMIHKTTLGVAAASFMSLALAQGAACADTRLAILGDIDPQRLSDAEMAAITGTLSIGPVSVDRYKDWVEDRIASGGTDIGGHTVEEIRGLLTELSSRTGGSFPVTVDDLRAILSGASSPSSGLSSDPRVTLAYLLLGFR